MDTLAKADRALVAEVLASGERKKLSTSFFANLQEAESTAIELFLNESENLVALSDAVEQCDTILGSLESVLSNFDSTLDAASDQILEHQRRSSTLFAELRDKRELRDQVHLFVEALVLTPKLIRDVSSAPVNDEAFAAALGELDRKFSFVNGSQRVRDSAAYKDVAIEMERLRLTAVKRGRDFVLQKMYELRQPGSNIQAQQQVLIKHRHVIRFLWEHGNNTYAELRAEYCASISSRFVDVFKSYWASLEGMEASDAGVLLGTATQQSGYYSYFESFFESKDSIQAESAQEAFFQLKDRLADSSKRVHEPPLMPSEGRRGKEPFEAVFASISRLLVDTAAHEYLFCKNFWQKEGRSVFRDAFRPILDFVHGSISAALQEQEDVIALLLCININRELFLVMTKRSNPALDDHFDAINMLLWPRAKLILDRHLQSVVELGASSAVDDRKHRNDEILPLTRRYAAMMASVLVIAEFITDGNISLNIEQLRYSVLDYLLTVSRRFTKRGEGTIFLLHNLYHVVSVLKTSGHAQKGFDEAFTRALGLYVDAKLGPYLEVPKEMSAAVVKKLRGEVRNELGGGGQGALAEVVERTTMSSLCERWNSLVSGLPDDDRGGLASSAEVFRWSSA